MNFPDTPLHNGAAEEQASLWAARLDGAELTQAERRQLDLWLEKSPLHRSLLSEYCQFSADLEERLPALLAAGEVQAPTAPVVANKSRRWWLLAAPGLAAAAALAFLFWTPRPQAGAQSYATPAGQRQTITLEDGTRVELNAQSNLIVTPTREERRVRLASGQAFFSVAKDTSRPFTVETPAGSVRVTGTAFDVLSEQGSRLSVTVSEGTVLVRPSAAGGAPATAPVSLRPGDLLQAGPEGVSVSKLDPTALDNALAWRQGQAVFTQTPLRDALSQFSKYHGRGLSATSAAGELRIGGRFSLDDLDGFLSSLEEVLPVQVSKDLSGAVRLRLRSEP